MIVALILLGILLLPIAAVIGLLVLLLIELLRHRLGRTHGLLILGVLLLHRLLGLYRRCGTLHRLRHHITVINKIVVLLAKFLNELRHADLILGGALVLALAEG